MNTVLISIITAIAAIFASTGFWAFVTKKTDNNAAEQKLLMGLAHDRLISQATKYIHRGYITHEEYDDIREYLYLPYLKKGGNGTVEKIMAEVDKLPIKAVSDIYSMKADFYGLTHDSDLDKFNKEMS